jgi:glutaredoxin 3
MSSVPLKVYVKPGCPWCIQVVADLRANGYAFEQIDVIADRNAFAEMQRLSGQSSAPTVTFGDLVLADCGVPELRAFLQEHGIQP